jgi:RNA polymerase sigma factor (sigma-70 family)
MAAAPGLIRFAARYTRSLPDAEDAYQRAMEIALTKAPVTEPRPFLSWLHTVLKHEAIAVARARRREGPAVEDDLASAFAEIAEGGIGPDAVVEWRDRYRAMQDALAGLTEAQRVCLMLQSAGASYARIGELTGYSARKIERSVLEGRRNLHRWEVGLAAGDVCASLLPAIDRVAAGEADAGETRSVRRHLRHCHPCRALLRSRRESREWLAALVPVALVGSQALQATPDPGPALAYWERLSAGMTVRMGQVVQFAMELPGAALAKVGAGTAAVAIAGVAGAPYVVDAVRPAPPDPAPVAVAQAIETPATPPAPAPSTTPARLEPSPARGARAGVTPARATFATRRRATPPAPTPSTPAAPPPPPVHVPPPSPTAAQIALEFGP